MSVLVLGASGMLGFTLHRVLHDRGYSVVGTIRGVEPPKSGWCLGLDYICGIDVRDFGNVVNAIKAANAKVVVNATVVKLAEKSVDDQVSLLQVNSVFPRLLGSAAEALGIYFVHFSTDGVFLGTSGMYDESCPPDSTDMYGMSKYLGEPTSRNCLVLRVSVLGRSPLSEDSLLDWFLRQSGVVSGFRRAVFSGLPAVEIARFLACRLLTRADLLTGLFHLSSAPITKYDLLKLLRAEWSMGHVRIQPDDTIVVDRSLNSEALRKAIAYAPPAWKELVADMRAFYASLDELAITQ